MTAAPEDLELALNLADLADRITTAAFRRADLQVETKADRTPVTEADRGVETEVRSVLAAARPGDVVVGEEFGTGGAGAGGSRRWIIDPIDGTTTVVRRIPIWATLLALEVDGIIELGVVSAPALGRRWWAGRGLGAFAASPASPAPLAAPPRTPATELTRIRVSSVSRLEDAYVSGNSLPAWKAGPDGFVRLASEAYWDRNLGDFWSHVLVAEGACDIGLDPVVSLWDLAALQVIVEEAGGRFTNLAGVPGPAGGSAISSNGLLHDAALATLNHPDEKAP